MMRSVFLTALMLSCVAVAADKPALPPTLQLAPDPDLKDPGRTFTLCVKLAGERPDKSIELAGKWIGLGGGEPAKLCQALSLIGLKEYGEGASRLEQLAEESRQEPASRASMLAKAGQAWMLQDEPGRAYRAQSAALKIVPQGTPQHVEILIDRAAILADAGKFDEVMVDLNAALKIDPKSSDALAFRASTYRSQGDEDEALADAESAVSANPANVNALLERGNLYRMKKRIPQARQDWLRILELDPESAAADAARANIARIDVDTGRR
jgi:tetratricopeptide (TPR) repeat protein